MGSVQVGSALNNEYVRVTLRGSGRLVPDGSIDIDFTATNGDFTNDVDLSSVTTGNQYHGVWTSGIGWEDTLIQDYDGPDRSVRAIGIRLLFDPPLFEPITEVDYSMEEGSVVGQVNYAANILYFNGGVELLDTGTALGAGSGTATASIGNSAYIDEILYLPPLSRPRFDKVKLGNG